MTHDTVPHIDLILDAHWLSCLRAASPEWSSSYIAILLGKAEASSLPEEASAGWSSLLAQLWRRRLAGWPGAAFALSAEDDPLASRAWDEPERWWRADPVHLLAGIDHVRLAAAGPSLALGAAQAEALAGPLRGHLQEVGLALHAVSPTRWYLRADRPWQATSVATAFAAGRDLRQLLAAGPDATALLGLQTECQMLLAQAPANAARAERGLPAVNSLWMWGGGVAADPTPPPWAGDLPPLHSGDFELRGAWHYGGGQVLLGDGASASVSERRAQLLSSAERGASALLVLDHTLLDFQECPGDTLAWLDTLLASLVRHRHSRVRLVAGTSYWRLPTGLRARRWWPFARDAAPLDLLVGGGGRADAHPWYSRGLRPPPSP